MKKLGNRGFAMPAAIFAIVIILVIVVGMFFTTRQDGRISSATENGKLALYTAERGMVDVLDDWSTLGLNSLGPWASQTFVGTLPEGSWSVEVYRAGTNLFFLESLGTVTQSGAILSGAERRLGMMVRVLTADIEPPAAITTRGPVAIRGNAEVHGEDVDPLAWGGLCTGPLTDKPGVINDDTTQVTTGGQGEITGTPPYVEDPSIDSTTFTQFGDLTWAELTAMANKTLSGGNVNQVAPSLVDGNCNTSDPYNWGDPLNPTAPCGSYFPIIYVAGSARMQAGGVGQGLLLVEGDLDLRGNFAFYGVIIVQGSFETQGTANRIIGGVFAGNASLDNQAFLGTSVVQNSTCAVTRAIQNNAALNRARPLAERSWVDLSLVQ